MAAVESDFDIYGDLDYCLQPTLSAKTEILIPEPVEDKSSELLTELQKENDKLKSENVLLTKNVSILLLTAKAEIERKDNQIKELRKEKDEIVFRKQKKNIHTSEKWSQTSSTFTKDSGSQTLGDKIENKRSNRDSRDYHKRPRSKERRSSRDDKSRKRSRSRDRKKRPRSSSRSHRHESARKNEKRPRTNYPSSTEFRYSKSKSKSTDTVDKEDKPKVLGAYEDISPIKRQYGDGTIHLYPTCPIQLDVKSPNKEKTSNNPVNGNYVKEPVPTRINFEPTEIAEQMDGISESKAIVIPPQKVTNTLKECPIAKTIVELASKEALKTVVVPLTPLSNLRTEPIAIKSLSLISKQPQEMIPKEELTASLKSPITFLKSPVVAVKSPLSRVKSPAFVIKSEPAGSPVQNLKSPEFVIKSEPPASPLPNMKSPAIVIKSEPASPTTSPSTPARKTNGIPTKDSSTSEQKVELTNSPEVAEKVAVKVEPTSPVVWENSNSTYRKEIDVDGAEVIKIVRKPRVKKRKVVVN
ncbi:unnamed protein product [Diamesa serratosioi]